MSPKDGGSTLAVRSGKTLATADIIIAKTSVGEIDSKVLYTEEMAKTESIVST